MTIKGILLAFAFTVLSPATALAQNDPALDPSGSLGDLATLDGDIQSQLDRLRESISLDEHPDFGTVTTNTYPAGDGAWTLADAHQDILSGATHIKMARFTFTGIGLTEHSDGDQTFYVWHEYKNEPVTLIASHNENDPATPTHAVLKRAGGGNIIVIWPSAYTIAPGGGINIVVVWPTRLAPGGVNILVIWPHARTMSIP